MFPKSRPVRHSKCRLMREPVTKEQIVEALLRAGYSEVEGSSEPTQYVSRVNPQIVVPIHWEGTDLNDLWNMLIDTGIIHEN